MIKSPYRFWDKREMLHKWCSCIIKQSLYEDLYPPVSLKLTIFIRFSNTIISFLWWNNKRFFAMPFLFYLQYLSSVFTLLTCRPYLRSCLGKQRPLLSTYLHCSWKPPTKKVTVALRRPQGMTGKTLLSNHVVVFNSLLWSRRTRVWNCKSTLLWL